MELIALVVVLASDIRHMMYMDLKNGHSIMTNKMGHPVHHFKNCFHDIEKSKSTFLFLKCEWDHF